MVSQWFWLYIVLTVVITTLVMLAWRRLSFKDDGGV
jgi:hypothetical protein